MSADQKTSQVAISGKIDGFEKYSEEYAAITVSVFDLIKSEINHPSFPDKNGNFSIRFQIDNQQDIYLVYANKLITLFIKPADSLFIHINADLLFAQGANPRSVAISGNSMQINTIITDFLPRYSEFLHKNYPANIDPDSRAKELSAEEYKTYLYERIQRDKDFLGKYTRENNTDNELFKKWASLQIEYEYIDAMLKYVRHHDFSFGKTEAAEKIPETYYDFLHDYPPTLTENLISAEYRFYLLDYISYSKLGFFDKNKMHSKDSLEIKYIESLFKQDSGLLRDIILSRTFYWAMDSNFDLLEPLFKTYLSSNINETYRNTISDKYNILFENDTAENLPVDASLHIILSKDSLLSEILNRHRNKVIYIDFWATWCSPCIHEFPGSRLLYDTFKEQDIAFVYLCNGSTKQSWQNMISTHNLAGDHYLLTSRQYEILSSFFQISGIPHYVLINQNGEIVDKNAKHPANPDLIEDIKALL